MTFIKSKVIKMTKDLHYHANIRKTDYPIIDEKKIRFALQAIIYRIQFMCVLTSKAHQNIQYISPYKPKDVSPIIMKCILKVL